MRVVERAETVVDVEGNINAPCEEPGPQRVDLSGILERGMHVRVVQEPGRSRRSGDRRNDLGKSKRAWSGVEKSERCIGAMTWGNQTVGPRRAKSSAEEQNRWRER